MEQVLGFFFKSCFKLKLLTSVALGGSFVCSDGHMALCVEEGQEGYCLSSCYFPALLDEVYVPHDSLGDYGALGDIEGVWADRKKTRNKERGKKLNRHATEEHNSFFSSLLPQMNSYMCQRKIRHVSVVHSGRFWQEIFFYLSSME